MGSGFFFCGGKTVRQHLDSTAAAKKESRALVLLVVTALGGCTQVSGSAPQTAEITNDVDEQRADGDAYETVSLRGQVVWTAESLKRQFGIRTVADARENSLALETDDGRLYPIVEDAQGHAFRSDERLRERDVELFARSYPSTGMIQVVRLYFVKPEGKFLVDYWCDVCSISMTEMGACSCCQAPNRLRERLVDESSGDVRAK